MDTAQVDGENKKDFNDSGVQDVGKHAEPEDRPAELLDLSDDVLLCILKYCSPMDLKALGFTCPRLGRLIRDRTLWTRVDARGHRTGRARLRWLLMHALGANTVELKLEGYAIAARGCYGHTDRKFRDGEQDKAIQESKEPASSSSAPGRSQDGPVHLIQEVEPLARLQRLYSQTRYSGLPTWTETSPYGGSEGGGGCPGPQFTLSQCALRRLRARTSLAHLALEYCNINCAATGISHFPPTLKRLSLKGTKCYNLPLDKSFLFNIQDYLPDLEHIDLSECEWLEPASLLPLSKLTRLTHLLMRDCVRLSEFVAYASLATRYGFKKLEVLDVRGSPVGDSEVSAFGWLGALRELYVAPAAPALRRPDDHSHCTDEPLPPYTELEPWELDEPEYFNIKPQTIEPPKSHANMTAEEEEQLREYENNLCLHGVDYNLCNEAEWKKPKSPLKRPSESSQDMTAEHTTQELSSSQTGQVIEVYLRARQGNPESPPVDIQPDIQQPRNEPEVLPKRKKMTEEVSLKDAGTSTNETGEGSSISGCSKDVASNQITEDGIKNEDEETPVLNKGPWKRKRPEEAPSCSDVGSNTCGVYLPSKKLKDGSSNGTDAEVECSKDNTNEKSGTSNGTDEKPGCSKDVSNTSDNNNPSKSQNGFNHGAGPSKDPSDEETDTAECSKPNEHPKGCKCKNKCSYVRFRQNMDPVIVQRDPDEVEREERERGERDREENENREVRPRAHVLYVNVGQQLHTVYRLSIHNEPPIFYSFAGNNHMQLRPNNMFHSNYSAPALPHLDGSSLVSDSAVRRFGRADVTDENVVHIGPRGGPRDQGSRPNRSSLRILSITGYRNITDRSLMHLVTAAPELRHIDFSNTRVTAQGVENFKSLRPDCEVKFSEYVEKKE